MNIRKIISVCLFIFLGFSGLSAQDSKISLPDVKTVVTGDNPEQKAVGPDFKDTYMNPDSTGTLVPDVPQAKKKTLSDNATNDDFDFFKDYSKVAVIGGAYPLSFKGLVKIQQNKLSEKDDFSILEPVPFYFDLNYLSDTYVASENKSSSYFSRNAEFTIYAPFYVSEENQWILSGGLSFYDRENGLQERDANALVLNQRFLDAKVEYQKQFGNKLLGVLLNTSYYSRDLSYTGAVDDAVKEGTEVLINPDVFFKIDFSDGDNALKDIIITSKNKMIQTKLNSSCKFMLDTQADFSFGLSKLNIDFGMSFALNIEHSDFVIAPLLVTYSYGDDDSVFFIKARTGVDTYLSSVYELEKDYKYSYAALPFTDTSDIIAEIFAKYKISDSLFITGETNFRNTFYNHGVWVCDYDAADVNGLYGLKQVSRMALNTAVGFEWLYNHMKISGCYKINFLDVLPLESRQMYEANVCFFNSLEKDNRWIINLGAIGSIGGNDDVPILNASFEKRFSGAIAFEAGMEDILKFVTGNLRNYAGGYIQDSGKIALVLKLNL